MKYTREMDFIKRTIREAYRRYYDRSTISSEKKSRFDIVTNIDKSIENLVINEIHRLYPNDRIISEEYHWRSDIQGRTWTIDPIDGTSNMANNIPLYGIQCALIENNTIVLSLIFLPRLREMFTAIDNRGVYMNGKRVRVIERDQMNAVVSFGDFSHKNLDAAKMEHETMISLSKKVAKIRMFGSAAIDLAYVAAGKSDGAVILTKNLWDIAPGILLCREAGALVANLLGQPHRFGDSGLVVAANQRILDDIIGSIPKGVSLLHT
ncbi:MAG: hypothetical protein A2Y16_00085 [Tenericutes bacterium GWF2_57_13]|nr:MAG: hypothetical protein A2Y16_00085 [Tenericutes bacterium GWF2_57_13]